MSVYITKFVEGEPASYPDIPDPDFEMPDSPSPSPMEHPNIDNLVEIWKRIEAYVAYRWSPRSVEWVVRCLADQSDWQPHLHPVSISEIYEWRNEEWVDVTSDVKASPEGGYHIGRGTYKFVGTAGDLSPIEVPDEVALAGIRLAEYWSEASDRAGVNQYEVDLGGLKESYTRNPAWLGKAMVNSGAADLLRRYRRRP